MALIPTPNESRNTRLAPIMIAAIVFAIALIPLGAAWISGAGAKTVGHVELFTGAKAPAGTNPQLQPFGAPSGKPDYAVPPPPGQPTLVPTIGTKTTQRLYGKSPFEEAVSITQHIWPAALPETARNENNNVPDRPWGLTLVTPDDPLPAITAVPLLHFPDD